MTATPTRMILRLPAVKKKAGPGRDSIYRGAGES